MPLDGLWRGDRQILAGIDLDASPGEVVALMGLSGSGKTTILRILAGLERADAGEIQVPTHPSQLTGARPKP